MAGWTVVSTGGRSVNTGRNLGTPGGNRAPV